MRARPVLAFLLLSFTPEISISATQGPYASDADTVHLFHFDEAVGATISANHGSVARVLIPFDGSAVPVASTTVQPVSTSILGATASPGFGRAANLGTSVLGLGLDSNGSGGFQPGTQTCPDAIMHSTLCAADGSFTLEALINLPGISGPNREIIATDSSMTNRGFQFRISSAGALEFNFISGSGAAVSLPVPTDGPHAFAPGEWFHVALAYEGGTGTSNLYWTRLALAPDEAHLLGSSILETTVGTVTGPLVIGNEGRAASGEGLLGQIDEVRISKRARGKGDFLFYRDDTDSDGDGLRDSWETLYFGNLNQDASGDPDGDGHANAAEQEAGSNPALASSSPLDTDGDGLADEAELRYFSGLSQTPAGDPDGDGENNASEFANGSAPVNKASNAADTDGDGLPDAWERQHFPGLVPNAGADPDADGWANLQEWESQTDPTDPDNHPAGTAARLVPLDDGDHATSEFGYAGSSAINTVSFVRSSLKTVGNQQFVTWYGRHQHDPSARFNNTIWIGRRELGSSRWEVFRHPTFTANAITDGHDVISYGIDGDGYMHVSWGMHGDAFHYSRSTTPVTGSGPIELGPDTAMTGRENTVTYPQFLKLPDGDLLFLFREVASGNGDTFINRYDTATQSWDNVHRSGSTQLPFIKGTGWTPNYNAYPNMPQLGGDGDDLILTWCWRYEPVGGDSPANENGYQTNNNFAFGRSTDAGLSWQSFDGTPYALPISRDGESGDPATAAEHIFTIPEGSSLINQASMCLDAAGNPVIGTWWAPQAPSGNHQRQYMVCFRHDNGTWQSRAVSSRSIDSPGSKLDENYVRNLGRPVVVHDDEGRIIVAYRDNQDANGLTIVHSLPKAQDPDRLLWIKFDLSTANLGNYEPIIDNELWDRDHQLHFLYQASAGEGYTPPDNTASRFSILEWDVARYFSHSPQPTLAKEGAGYRITCPSQPSWSYRLWSSTDLTAWEPVQTLPGTGGTLEFTAPAEISEARRYWRVEYREGGF